MNFFLVKKNPHKQERSSCCAAFRTKCLQGKKKILHRLTARMTKSSCTGFLRKPCGVRERKRVRNNMFFFPKQNDASASYARLFSFQEERLKGQMFIIAAIFMISYSVFCLKKKSL